MPCSVDLKKKIFKTISDEEERGVWLKTDVFDKSAPNRRVGRTLHVI